MHHRPQLFQLVDLVLQSPYVPLVSTSITSKLLVNILPLSLTQQDLVMSTPESASAMTRATSTACKRLSLTMAMLEEVMGNAKGHPKGTVIPDLAKTKSQAKKTMRQSKDSNKSHSLACTCHQKKGESVIKTSHCELTILQSCMWLQKLSSLAGVSYDMGPLKLCLMLYRGS